MLGSGSRKEGFEMLVEAPDAAANVAANDAPLAIDSEVPAKRPENDTSVDGRASAGRVSGAAVSSARVDCSPKPVACKPARRASLVSGLVR